MHCNICSLIKESDKCSKTQKEQSLPVQAKPLCTFSVLCTVTATEPQRRNKSATLLPYLPLLLTAHHHEQRRLPSWDPGAGMFEYMGAGRGGWGAGEGGGRAAEVPEEWDSPLGGREGQVGEGGSLFFCWDLHVLSGL